MVGFSDYAENEILDHALAGLTWTAPANTYIKLHLADPGEAGTVSPALNAVRKQITWAVASGGSKSSSANIVWSTGDVTDTEVYSHYSLWDTVGPTGGNCIGTGTVTNGSVTAGNTFTINSGTLTFTLD